MQLLSDVLKYLMDKAGPLAVVLMLVIWWGYKLLLRREDVIDKLADNILKMRDQMEANRDAQIRTAVIWEERIHGRNNQ